MRFRAGPLPGTPSDPPTASGAPGRVLYAIGDVHGRADLLDDLFERIGLDARGAHDPDFTILLLGDLIDRGPSSREVIERVSTLQRRIGTRCVSLKGNHEAMMLGFLSDPSTGPAWMQSGGLETLRAYVGSFERPRDEAGWRRLVTIFAAAVPPSHTAFLDALPSLVRWGDYVLVHAGVDPDVALEDQTEQVLLWDSARVTRHRGRLSYTVVHGHTPAPDGVPKVTRNRIAIDTGAYVTGVLTAVRLEGHSYRFIQTGSRAKASGERDGPRVQRGPRRS